MVPIDYGAIQWSATAAADPSRSVWYGQSRFCRRSLVYRVCIALLLLYTIICGCSGSRIRGPKTVFLFPRQKSEHHEENLMWLFNKSIRSMTFAAINSLLLKMTCSFSGPPPPLASNKVYKDYCISPIYWRWCSANSDDFNDSNDSTTDRHPFDLSIVRVYGNYCSLWLWAYITGEH